MTKPSPNFASVTPKTIIAVGAVLPFLAAIAVSLRFYVRIKILHSVGLDDWLILISLVNDCSSSWFNMKRTEISTTDSYFGLGCHVDCRYVATSALCKTCFLILRLD